MPAPLANLVRLAVAAAVGGVVGLLAHWGLHLGAAWDATLMVAMMAAVTSVYHTAVTVLERKFPWLKILLGNVASPNAKPGPVVSPHASGTG